MRTVRITGNTFPVRQRLRDLGGEWDPVHRCWRVPEDKAEAARRAVKFGMCRRITKKPNRPATETKPENPEPDFD